MKRAKADKRFERGLLFHQSGRLDDARRCYAQVPAGDPNHPHAVHYLGLIALQEGDYPQAVALIGNAIEAMPRQAEFHVNLGNALERGGDSAAAIAAYERALALRPDFAAAHANRGLALASLGRNEEAALALAQALRLDAQLHAMRLPLARLLLAAGDFAGAATQFDLALPALRDAAAAVEAGHAALAWRRPEAALAYFEFALGLANGNYEAMNGRGAALAQLGRLSEAIAAFEAACRSAPERDEARENLAITLKDAARIEEALPHFRAALERRPDAPGLWSNYLFSLLYAPREDAGEVAAAHARFGQMLAARSPAPAALPARPSGGRVRVGYVSGDFLNHPVMQFMLGLLAHHDRSRFEIFAYPTTAFADAVTEEARRRVDAWRPAAGLDDAALAAQIRADGIDVLVDLAGHTADNRLPLFAARAAPVQLSYLGYPHATGVAAMDGRLVDAVTDPDDIAGLEPAIRLPRCYYGFTPPEGAPTVGPLPLQANGHFTFGVASNLAKVSAPALDDWAALLQAFPTARLRWRTRPFADPGVREDMLARLGRRGIGAERLQLEGWLAAGDRWAALSAVDVALDTRPYNQATNTCEALWMGVPTLTVRGASHAGRMGASILAAAGLPECVGESVADWIALVGAWQAEPGRLADLRAGLRARLLASPLLDCAGLARDIEAAYLAALAARSG